MMGKAREEGDLHRRPISGGSGGPSKFREGKKVQGRCPPSVLGVVTVLIVGEGGVRTGGTPIEKCWGRLRELLVGGRRP